MSGSPHGVFGGTYGLADAALAGAFAGACAPAVVVTAAANAATIATVNKPLRIRPLLDLDVVPALRPAVRPG